MVKGDFDDNNNYTNDDNELVLGDEDQFGGAEVIGESIPNKLLPNTGGVSPFAVLLLAALGSAFVVATLTVGYAAAVVRRRP
jgi:hypothetical protein